jgi:UDP-N-acetylmuramate dehydrogenase
MTELSAILLENDVEFKKDFLLAALSTFRIGGKADMVAYPDSAEKLIAVIRAARTLGTSFEVVGNCSNLLFSDKGFRGAIVSLKGLTSLRFSDGIVLAMAGVNLCDLVLFSAEYQLFGGEQLAGIPATVGGAVVMNAGAFGKTISDFIQQVTTIKDGKIITYQKDQCDFCYRNQPHLIAPYCYCLQLNQ